MKAVIKLELEVDLDKYEANELDELKTKIVDTATWEEAVKEELGDDIDKVTCISAEIIE